MELVQPDRFAQDLSALPSAPDHHTPSFGDDLAQFGHDLTQPGLGHTGASARAAANDALENDLSFGVSDSYVMARQYAPIVEALNKDRGPFDPQLVFNPFTASSLNPLTFADRIARGQPITRDGQEEMIWSRLGQLRQQNPGLAGNLPASRDEMIADMRAEQRTAHDYAGLVAGGGGFLTGAAPAFAGGIAAGSADPVNLAMMALGLPAAETLLKKVLIEGGANMAATAITMPSLAAHYSDIGEPMSAGDMAGEIAGAGLFGGALGAGVHLLGKFAGMQGRELLQSFEEKNPDPSPTFRAAMNIVDDGQNLADTSPFGASAQAVDLHRQALVATEAALDDRRPDMVPDFSDQTLAAARASQPDAFAAFEGAAAERDALRQQLADLGAARSASPAVIEAQGRIDQILAKVNGVEERLASDARDRLTWARADKDAVLTGDTAEMAQTREQLMAADARMRDAGPTIAKAMAEAKASLPEVLAASANRPQPEAAADRGQHVPRHDPEALKPFTDPVRKPKAFHEQADALALEISPAPEVDPQTQSEAPGGPRKKTGSEGGAAQTPASGAPESSGGEPDFGAAQAQIEALRRLPDEATLPDPLTGEETALKDVRAEIERQAGAVERLRACLEKGG